MGAHPAISVVLPVFNGLPFLDTAMRSIRNQDFGDFEIIAIDDGSTDGSAAVLAAHARDDSRIRVITQENSGLIAALNRGLAVASGAYIARMDADDVALPDRFRQQVAFLETHPHVAVVGGAIELIDNQDRPLHTVRYPSVPEDVHERLAQGAPVAHPAVMMRRAIITTLGGYRPAFQHAEDYDLWLRVAEVAQIANLPDIVLRYRQHPTKVSFRHAEQQAVATLAAQAAARLRQRGMKDPANEVDGPSDTLFAALGLERPALDRARFDLLKASAYSCLNLGDIAAGAEYISRVRRYADRHTACATIADYMITAAGTHAKQSDHIKALARLIDAVRIAPVFAARRFVAHLKRAI